MSETDPRIDKRRVTISSVVAMPADPDGTERFARHEMVDYVRPDFLEQYVADARTRWQLVEVSDEPDAGPGGYHGETHIPAHLDHPDAGTTFAATQEA